MIFVASKQWKFTAACQPPMQHGQLLTIFYGKNLKVCCQLWNARLEICHFCKYIKTFNLYCLHSLALIFQVL
jgi:hypothetical protein